MEKKEAMKVSPPWITWKREIEEMFKDDPEIRITYDYDTYTIKMYVDNEEKADALGKLLPSSRTFGAVVAKLNVIHANQPEVQKIELFSKAFERNPAFVGIFSAGGLASDTFHYVAFKNKVVQFFNDNLSDPHGYVSTLYQEIAKDLFEDRDGIFFCTYPPDDEMGVKEEIEQENIVKKVQRTTQVARENVLN